MGHHPAKTGIDNGTDVSIGVIITNTISPLTYIAGAPVNVPFTSNVMFNPDNIFTAQLSDSAGSFAHTAPRTFPFSSLIGRI